MNEKLKMAMSAPDIALSSNIDFLPEEIETLDYIKELLELTEDDIEYKKVTRYAYMHLKGCPSKWICRIFIRTENRLFVLRSFSKHDFETEYYFDNISQLKQIKNEIKSVYNECKLI